MKNLLNNFWIGKITLWKSFWIIGLVHGLSIMYLIPILEIYIFHNYDLYNSAIINNIKFDLLDYRKVTFISKLLFIFSTTFMTVGVWRSAENYKGNFIVVVISLFYLSINNIAAIIFYFKNLFI